MSKIYTTIRIEFIRGEEVKFISHLDIMRTFERAIRRAKIPVAYSQGFNPKPSIVFGLPLSVGVTSLAEYADIGLAEPIQPLEFKKILNKELPKGLRILNAVIRQDEKNIMSLIYMASYEIFVYCSKNLINNEMNNEFNNKVTNGLNNGLNNELNKESMYNNLENITKRFLRKDVIIAKKESKRGTRDINIKPMIFDFNIKLIDIDIDNCINFVDDNIIEGKNDNSFDGGGKCIHKITAMLRAGGEANLKPELLIEALNENANLDLKIARIHRTGLFVNKDGVLIKPI